MKESISYLDPIGLEEECQRLLAVFHQYSGSSKVESVISIKPIPTKALGVSRSRDGDAPKKARRRRDLTVVASQPLRRSQNDGDRDELLMAFLADRNNQALKKKMIVSWIPLVHLTIKSVHTDFAKFQYADYVGMGSFGLLEAIENYDPAKGATFKTYVIGRIRFALLNGTQEGLGWHNALGRIERITSEQKKIEEQEKQGVLDEETRDRKAWLQERREEIIRVIHVDSLDRPISHLDSETLCVGDHVRDPVSVEEEIMFEYDYILLSQKVASLFSRILTEREEKIIRLRLGNGLTLAETGKEVRLGGERVRQIELIALEKIRDVMEPKKTTMAFVSLLTESLFSCPLGASLVGYDIYDRSL